MDSTNTDKTTAAWSNGRSARSSVRPHPPRMTCRGQRFPETRSAASRASQQAKMYSQATARSGAFSSMSGLVESVVNCVSDILDPHFNELSMAVMRKKPGGKEDFDQFCSEVQRKIEGGSKTAGSTQSK